VFSFGSNRFGQLGIGNNEDQNKPIEISFFKGMNVDKIYSSNYHCFAISSNSIIFILIMILDSKLFAWGDNSYCQFGNGNEINSNSPLEITFFKNLKIEKISCGFNHTLVISSNFLFPF
jgi:alpha-tubulin suppressor-like RCC1 family protein